MIGNEKILSKLAGPRVNDDIARSIVNVDRLVEKVKFKFNLNDIKAREFVFKAQAYNPKTESDVFVVVEKHFVKKR